MLFLDSSQIDYSKLQYDMVFTSPPYIAPQHQPGKFFLNEEYSNMPEYSNADEFYNVFLFPVIIKTFQGLNSGGIYALNIPVTMYNRVCSVLGACNTKFKLPIRSRWKHVEYIEYIYVWYKLSQPSQQSYAPRDNFLALNMQA